MSLFDIIALALIQGITEFLPISSSAHLILWPLLTGRTDQGVTMDVAVHFGTLIAVCLYFRTDTARLFIGGVDILRGRRDTGDAKLAFLIAIATVPAVVAGLTLKLLDLDQGLRAIEVIGWATLLGGILLWIVDRRDEMRLTERAFGGRDAILMGLAQATALIPGVSRSGITMTMARALGYRRDEAARLALLMAIPVILAASLVETAGVIADGDLVIGSELLLGALLSGIAAWVALVVMMRMFKQNWTMLPFVIYRLILGVILLGLVYL
ncbi:MAG: undecaprenyl-diphosphate phosphatase [Pseudomonadota bacterium]